jgi:hypothetical protein
MTTKPFVPAKRLPISNPKRKDFRRPLIQLFIAHNTYGTVWYKGSAFNLMDQIDFDVLIMWLVADGWVSFGDAVERYPYNKGYDTFESFTVHHPLYPFIRHTAVRFFWYNLLDRLLPQLTDEELALFNQQRKERYDAILQRTHQTHV